MADEKSPDQGAANMDGALSGAGGLSDINKEQLAHLGGTLDPIDTEDFSDADFGNVLPDDFDPKAPPVDTKTDADAEDDADEADDKDKESDDDAEADADKDSDDAEDKADADSDADSGKSDEDADAKADDDADKADADDADTTDESDDKPDTADKKDEDEPAKKREQQIPKSRFDEVNARRRAAEEELAALKAENDAADKAEDFDFNKAELAYLDLALSGKTEEAMAKRNEIRSAEQAAYLSHAGKTATDATVGASEQGAVNELTAEYEAKYAGFNPDSDDYSEDLIDEVAGMFAGYQTLGFTRPEAFKMALDNVVKIYELTSEVFDADKGEPATDKGDEKPSKTKKPIKKTKEKLKAAKKQPADPSKAGGAGDGDRGTTTNIEDMTDDELAALPPATLARMRGDTI